FACWVGRKRRNPPEDSHLPFEPRFHHPPQGEQAREHGQAERQPPAPRPEPRAGAHEMLRAARRSIAIAAQISSSTNASSASSIAAARPYCVKVNAVL